LLFVLSGLVMALFIFPRTGGAQSASAAAQAPAAAATQAPAPAQTPTQAAPAVPSSRLVIPSETTIPLVLKNTINSRTAHVGQAIYCETIFPITLGNRIVIPVGSSVKGAVTQVVRPGRVKGRAQIGLRFETIILPNGTTRQLRASLSGFGGTGNEDFNARESKIKGQSSKGEDAGKVAQTAVTGAEIGTITGAVRGSPGKGLAIGSLAGAAGGLIWVLASRGKEVVLPSGTNLELQLTTPLSFERDEVEPPGRYDEGPALPRRDLGPGF
jgi:type IV secretion system protein VirB10